MNDVKKNFVEVGKLKSRNLSGEKKPNSTTNIPSLSYRKSEQLLASFQFMLTNFAFVTLMGR